jgi:alginate O-acetyltransferase complex protein AlgF
MQFGNGGRILRLALAALLVCLGLVVAAQPTGLLYDPEPPPDSAYVRVLLAGREAAVDILVDGRLRIKKLAAGEASDYMVLTAGQHTLALHPAGKSAAVLSTTIDVVRGRAMTVAYTALRAATAPVVFEDKANSNKLKALLTVYHLDANAGMLDVLTRDGSTKVFSNVAYGISSARQVNPISIELIAAKVGDQVAQAGVSLAMTQGGNYSILLLPGEGGKLILRAVQSKIERYTGK